MRLLTLLHLLAFELRAEARRELLTSLDGREQHLLVLVSVAAAGDEALGMVQIHALEGIGLGWRG